MNAGRQAARGTRHAVSSMKPLATDAAFRVLEAGGNAFDAAVAGQAVLALVDPAMNGFGADAEVLVYDARAGQVVSINGTAPAAQLATIAYSWQPCPRWSTSGASCSSAGARRRSAPFCNPLSTSPPTGFR
jgi:gamma-glutamyltranspeptidase